MPLEQDNWQQVALLPIRHDDGTWGNPTVAFSPVNNRLLATLNPSGTSICIWELDFAQLRGVRSPEDTVYYTSARIALVGNGTIGKSGLGWLMATPWSPTRMRRSPSSVVVRRIPPNTSPYLTACLSLRSTWTPVSGGLLSESHGTQRIGAGQQRNGKSRCACITRKQPFRKPVRSSTLPCRSRASWTRSFVKATHRNHGRAFCTQRVPGSHVAPSVPES